MLPAEQGVQRASTTLFGLDEISPKEFAQFIGKAMVLAHGHRVEYAPRAESAPIFSF